VAEVVGAVGGDDEAATAAGPVGDGHDHSGGASHVHAVAAGATGTPTGSGLASLMLLLGGLVALATRRMVRGLR
jgi:hypothetical protein